MLFKIADLKVDIPATDDMIVRCREYLTDDADKDIDGNTFNGYIIFTKTTNDYRYSESPSAKTC